MTPRLALVVDDDEMIRRLVRAVLEADDWRVVEASNGEEAFRCLGNGEPPAVVVLDVMMPGLDGVEICRQIDHDIIRVVMLTARDDPVLERACFEAGADAFVTKPFSSVQLLELVEKLGA